jgi:hypothetical protein
LGALPGVFALILPLLTSQEANSINVLLIAKITVIVSSITFIDFVPIPWYDLVVFIIAAFKTHEAAELSQFRDVGEGIPILLDNRAVIFHSFFTVNSVIYRDDIFLRLREEIHGLAKLALQVLLDALRLSQLLLR